MSAKWYEVCEYCPVLGEREKSLPFGTGQKVLFVLANYIRPNEDELTKAYPDALFVRFTACANVEERESAEVSCSVLLRNVARPFYKIFLSDYDPLRKVFGVKGDSGTKEDGTQFVVYKGKPLDKETKEGYRRLLNA